MLDAALAEDAATAAGSYKRRWTLHKRLHVQCRTVQRTLQSMLASTLSKALDDLLLRTCSWALALVLYFNVDQTSL